MVDDNKFKFQEIISALIAGTRGGKVIWDWNSKSRSATANFMSGRLVVSKDRDFDTVLEIQNSARETIERINTGYVRWSVLKTDADKLYELARRAALGVDSTLEALLREISE